MTRRIPPAAKDGQATTPLMEAIEGGSVGIPEASTKIHDGTPETTAFGADEVPDVPVKRWRVKNDPPAGKTGYPILYDGCLSLFPKGKIVSETAYDIDKLRDQGLELEEMGATTG